MALEKLAAQSATKKTQTILTRLRRKMLEID
jgi:hypothetical protein